MTIQGTNFYSVEETAKILGITKKTLYNWTSRAKSSSEGHGPVLRTVTAPNGRKFYREEAIIAVLSQFWGVDVSHVTLDDNKILVHA